MDINYDKDPIAAAAQPPHFFDTPGVDELFGMVTALSEQLAVWTERQDTLIRVLEAKGLLAQADLENYDPPPEVIAARQAQHTALSKAVLKPIEDALQSYSNRETTASK